MVWSVDRTIEFVPINLLHFIKNIVEMRMLGWWVVMREDKITNELVRSNLGVVLIVDKMKENRQWWIGHIMHFSKSSKSGYGN